MFQSQAMMSVRMMMNWDFILCIRLTKLGLIANRYAMEMKINSKPCMMKLDTAADFSIMSKSEYLEKFADKPLTPSQVILKTYTGKALECQAKCIVT